MVTRCKRRKFKAIVKIQLHIVESTQHTPAHKMLNHKKNLAYKRFKNNNK